MSKKWIIEKQQPTALRVALVSLLAILVTLFITGLIFSAYGFNPIEAFTEIFQKVTKSRRSFFEVLRKAIPLMLCGVGLVVAFRAQFWNIGAEGQILAGAVAASGVALFTNIPAPFMLPCMFIAGFLAGGMWGFLPAILKIRLGVNEIITTLMMNYIAIFIVQWLISGPWQGATTRGFARSDTFEKVAWIPIIEKTRLHWPTLVVAVVLAIVVALLLSRSKLGFEIRVMGSSPEAARYAGINFFRTTLLLMLISGGAAGLAGVGEVGGILHRLDTPLAISQGYGYMAIIVALLARGKPMAVILTALLLGFVFASGDIMKVALRMPVQMTSVISGLLLLVIICAEPLMNYRLRRVSKTASLDNSKVGEV